MGTDTVRGRGGLAPSITAATPTRTVMRGGPRCLATIVGAAVLVAAAVGGAAVPAIAAGSSHPAVLTIREVATPWGTEVIVGDDTAGYLSVSALGAFYARGSAPGSAGARELRQAARAMRSALAAGEHHDGSADIA
jgi:hypothetical protein